MIEHLNGSNREIVVAVESSQEWTVRRVAHATVITLGIGFGFFLLYQFYMIVFLFFVAVTLAVAIRPIVEWLRAWGLPEGVGVLVVYALLLAILIGLALLVGPLLVEQINTLVAQLPEYYRQLRLTLADSGNRLLEQVVRALPAVPALPTPALAEDSSPFVVLTPALQFMRTSGYVIFVFGAVVLLAFYWTVEGELITRRIMLLAPINRREEVRTLLAEMGGTIGGYFRGQAVLCVLVGILSLIGYWSIGLPYALGLALVMAIFEAVPMIGPILGSVPAVLVAFSTAPELVLWVLGVVVVIQVLENNLLVPRVMNQSVGVSPIVSMLSITAFGALFGLVGAILAIPLAAMLQIVFNRLFFRLPSADELVVAAQAASSTERNVASKIRLQAQEIVIDVRKGMRGDDGTVEPTVEPEVETIQDSLEAIALELDSLLSRGANGMKDFALKVTVVFAILLAAVALWQLRSIVALVLVSLAITAAMRAPIAYLIGRGVRRGLAMLLVYGLAIGGIVGLFFLLSYPLTGEFTQLGENIITAYTRLENGRRVFGRLDALLADRLPTVEELAALLTSDQMPIIGQAVLDVTQNIGAIVGQFLLAMVLSIYWTADQVRFERFWLSLLPANQRLHARDLWHALEAQVGAYLRSEIIQSVLAGVLLVPGFWLLGVDYPVIWALLISVAWLVPLVGGLIFLIPLWLTVWVGEGALMATAASVYALVVLAFMEFFVERRLYTQTRYSHVLVILVMLMLVNAYGIVGLLLAPLLATAIEVLLAKLGETTSKSPVQDIADIDVSLLQSRLDETRQLVSTLDTPSSLRLANMADRLDGLLKQTEAL